LNPARRSAKSVAALGVITSASGLEQEKKGMGQRKVKISDRNKGQTTAKY
jgi:hypothetical protein